MKATQRERFERWRRRLPPLTQTFVSLVVDEIVPLFTEQGYGWYADYAAGRRESVAPNTIPLQKREGAEWPTVEILLGHRGRPSLGVSFAWLPEECHRPVAAKSWVAIARIEANVGEGPVVFSLCQGRKRQYDCNYGVPGASSCLIWRPEKRIQREIAALKKDCQWLIEVLNRPMPTHWLEGSSFGYVDRHASLSPASQAVLRRRSGLPSVS